MARQVRRIEVLREAEFLVAKTWGSRAGAVLE